MHQEPGRERELHFYFLVLLDGEVRTAAGTAAGRLGTCGHTQLGIGLGKYNRGPSTEPKEPSTGTKKTGTEKFRFYFGSTF